MDDHYAINVAKTEIREGYNTGDVERVLSAYLDGFTYLSDGLPSFGAGESLVVLRERLTRLFTRFHVEFVPVMISVTLFGDTALDYGWHQFTLHSRQDGSVNLVRNRYVELWKKRPDGTWAIALFIDNADHRSLLLDDMLQALRDGVYDPEKLPGYRTPNSTQNR